MPSISVLSILAIVSVVYFVMLVLTWSLLLRASGLRPIKQYLVKDLKPIIVITVVQALILLMLLWLTYMIMR